MSYPVSNQWIVYIAVIICSHLQIMLTGVKLFAFVVTFEYLRKTLSAYYAIFLGIMQKQIMLSNY